MLFLSINNNRNQASTLACPDDRFPWQVIIVPEYSMRKWVRVCVWVCLFVLTWSDTCATRSTDNSNGGSWREKTAHCTSAATRKTLKGFFCNLFPTTSCSVRVRESKSDHVLMCTYVHGHVGKKLQTNCVAFAIFFTLFSLLDYKSVRIICERFNFNCMGVNQWQQKAGDNKKLAQAKKKPASQTRPIKFN